MNEWRDIFDDSPDWPDANRRILLRYADGREIKGKLQADSLEDDPVFTVVLEDGTETSFYDAEQWRLDDNG